MMDGHMLPELEQVDHPPGPGPGYQEEEDDLLCEPPYLQLHLHPPISPRLPPPPPVPVMDYQSDHSSNFTQTFLRGILTSIDSKDPVVANAWLETLLDAIDLLPIEVIKQEIIIIAINKSQLSQPPFSRIAACKILGKLSTKLDQQAVRQEILPSSLALCQDVESEVRNVMCRHLAFVARGIGLELTKTAILPVLVELSNDESAEVRLAAIETVVHLLSLLDDEICNNTIVPLVMKSCDQARTLEDCTLPVIARHLGRLCHGLTPNLSEEQKSWFISFYQQLSQLGTTGSTEAGGSSSKPMPDLVPRTTEDKSAKYTECRQACAYNLPGFVLFVGINNFPEKLASTFCDFAVDPSPLVRKTVAASLHELIKIIGTNFCLLKMQIVALFNDTNIEVLSAMVLNMVYVIDALARFGVLQFGSTSNYSQDLSLSILHMEEIINTTRNWRLHSDCLEKLSCLANCISASVIHHRYIPLLFLRAQKSRPLPSRVAAVRTLLVILRFTVKQEDRISIVQRIKTEFARGRSCHSRMLFLKMCEMAMCLFSKLYFKTHLFSEFLCLSQDSVANIRLKVVSLLPQLKSLLVLPADSAHLQHLEETIKELLVVETDRDVLGALQTAIHHLAEIETAMDGMMGKMSLYSEEDLVDDRKLREERLIANMEEQIKAVQGAKFDQLISPSAIPSRLRSLEGLERKRSESLPPARSRAEPVSRARPRYSSPEPQRYAGLPASPLSASQDTQLPSLDYSQDLWTSDKTFEEKDFKVKNNPGPFSASLENLDTQDSSFLVDAGIKLPSMSSAASMPNLTAVGKVRDQLSRSNSIPDSSGNIEGEMAKYLISNEEMEHYEAEYHKSARESLSPGPATARGRPESRMKPPSFTSALTSRPAPSATAVSVSVNKSPISFSAPIQKPEKQEVRLGLKPVGNKSNQSARNSPPKSADERSPNQQRWNDGSIERLAEKWAAKRDALLKETGVIAENLQQRKAAMEQKLESVKRSIPKRSMGFTAQSAQKRLSLCETTVSHNKPGKEGTPLTKRKSLDVDLVIAPTESTSEESDEDNTSATEAAKSPELGSGSGSSDSDDSLPPYPAPERQSPEPEKPLPPPPTLQYSSSTTTAPLPPPPSATSVPPLNPTKSPSLLKSRINSSTNLSSPSKGSVKSSSRLQLFSNSLSKSSMATFKTVTAPQTSVAVSRQLPAPMRSIADSPRLPLPSQAPDSKAPSSLLTFRKINPEEGKKEAVESPGSRVAAAIKPPLEPPTSKISAIKPQLESPASRISVVKPPVEPPRKISGMKPPLESPSSRISAIKPPVELPVSKTFVNKPPLEPPASRISSIKPPVEPPVSRISALKSPAKKPVPTTDLSKVKIPQKNDCRSSDVNNPGTDSSVLHINRSMKRVSKLATTQISSINRHDTASFSSFKMKCPEDDSPSVEQKEGKTIVYIENNTGNKLKAPSSILPRERSKMLSPKPQVKSQTPTSPSPSPSPSKLKPGRYGGKSLSVDSGSFRALENGSGEMRSFLTRSTNKIAGTRSGGNGTNGPGNGQSPLGSSENLVGPTPTAGKLSGPRRSLGLRMWPGSPVTSRSPSPSTPSSPSRITRSAHSTLPRTSNTSNTSNTSSTSNISRLRVPGPSPHQRRSYGGGAGGAGGAGAGGSGGGGGVGGSRSAPATPRHSQADLGILQSPGGSRSSSPVILRRAPDNHEKPPSKLRSLNMKSMLKRPTRPRPAQDCQGLARPTTTSRGGPGTAPTTTVNNNKSRLQPPPKTFGFSY